MRLTVLNQTAKGLPMAFDDHGEQYELWDPALKIIDSIKWYLWHGNTYKALEHLETLEMDLDAATEGNKHSPAGKLLRAVEEFHTYIANNQAFIPNYGERYRQGERISTGFVESAVNYVVAKGFTKRQQMQWSPKGPIYSCRCGRGSSTASWNKRFETGIPAFGRLARKALKRQPSLPWFCMLSHGEKPPGEWGVGW